MKKQSFDNLFSLARQDRAPDVDVTDHVMAALSAMVYTAAADPYRMYKWFGVASAAVAACILIAATMSWQSTDAVSEMLTYVSWVTQ